MTTAVQITLIICTTIAVCFGLLMCCGNNNGKDDKQ